MTISVQHLTPKNLLRKLQLNPAWEKWRGYCYLAGAITTITAIYQTLKGLDVHCVPDYSGRNSSSNPDLSGPAIAYVNAICSVSKSLYSVRYSGIIMLTCDVAILFSSSFWLHIPNIAAQLTAFDEARKKLQEPNYECNNRTRICKNILKPDNIVTRTEKEQEFIRGISSLYSIYNGVGSSSVFQWYIIRGVVSVGMLAFSTYCSIYYCLELNSVRTKRFGCQLNQYASFPNLEAASVFTVQCASNDAKMIVRLFIIFTFFVIVQLFCISYGLARVLCGVCCASNGSKTFQLLMIFENSVRPWRTEILRDLLHHLIAVQSEFQQNLRSVLEEEINFDEFRRYERIFGPMPGKFTIALLHEDFELGDDRHYDDIMYLKAMEASEYSLGNKQVNGFLKALADKRHWELFVNFIENSTSKEKTAKISEFPEVSLTAPSQYGEECSILHYAFRKKHLSGPVKFAAARLLCEGKTFQDLKVITTREQVHDEFRVIKVPQETDLKSYLESIYSQSEVDNILKEINWKDETCNQATFCYSIRKCRLRRQQDEHIPMNVPHNGPSVEEV